METLRRSLRRIAPTARELTVRTMALIGCLSIGRAAIVTTDTFGSGANQFAIDFVEVGNAGNADDTVTPNPSSGGVLLPAGAVNYTYRIGKFEISQDAVTKATLTGALSNVTAGAWTGNQPAGNMSWYEAAAFVNWLNDQRTPGLKAYDLTWTGSAWTMNLWSSAQAWQAGGENRYRNANAYYFLPSEDEWYKAAYYDPNKSGGAGYWLYATGSDTAPTPVVSGTLSGSAVYNGQAAPANVALAGGESPYGTVGQNGNLWEWAESADNGLNNDPNVERVVRGGSFQNLTTEPYLAANFGGHDNGFTDNLTPGIIGFRVASVPEPTVVLLNVGAGLAISFRRRRTRRP